MNLLMASWNQIEVKRIETMVYLSATISYNRHTIPQGVLKLKVIISANEKVTVEVLFHFHLRQ